MSGTSDMAFFLIKNESDQGEYKQGEKWFLRDLVKMGQGLGQRIDPK